MNRICFIYNNGLGVSKVPVRRGVGCAETFAELLKDSVQEESELQGWENGDMREVADLWVALEADACGV